MKTKNSLKLIVPKLRNTAKPKAPPVGVVSLDTGLLKAMGVISVDTDLLRTQIEYLTPHNETERGIINLLESILDCVEGGL